jgi:hypothetical protein
VGFFFFFLVGEGGVQSSEFRGKEVMLTDLIDCSLYTSMTDLMLPQAAQNFIWHLLCLK